MYEIAYGSKYDASLDVAEIAKRVRSEIKGFVKASQLPADWKYSVRLSRFAGGQSIDIRAESPLAIYLCAPNWYSAGSTDRYLDLPIKGEWQPCAIPAKDQWHVSHVDAEVAGVAYVRQLLEQMLGAYNYDGSDIMTDYFNVNFYSHVSVTTMGPWENAYQRIIDYLPKETAS